MCTVILSLRPGDAFPLLVGANRDESPSRPSTHFETREGGRALYPLDVGGGTWIGTNDRGIFAAITNRDDVKDVRGRESRGALVKKLLSAGSVAEASEWADLLEPFRFNGFRLIAADSVSCVVWEADGSARAIRRLELAPGLHTVTGFGLDTWNIPRCAAVVERLPVGFGPEDLKKILALHQTGKVDSDVCVHDPGEHHITVSSCIIAASADWSFGVDAVRTAPCLGNPWDRFDIERRFGR